MIAFFALLRFVRLMKTAPIPFATTVFVCENARNDGSACCGAAGSALRAELKTQIAARGVNKTVRVSRAGCLGRCSEGPNVFVYSATGACWYAGVTPDDVPEIVAQIISPHP